MNKGILILGAVGGIGGGLYLLQKQGVISGLPSLGSLTGDYKSRAADLIAGFEGFSATPYPDPPGQTTTYSIGYGHQLVAGDGYDMSSDLSEGDAKAQLVADLDVRDQCITDNVTVDLNDDQRVALLSFIYNEGCSAFESSTLLQKLNAGDTAGAADEFAVWNKVHQGGQLVVSDALSQRRAQEAQIFSS